MKKILGAVIALALLAFSNSAYADCDARVRWSAPTQRVDGSTLNNLAGYRVLWGSVSRTYTQAADINDPATLTHFITGLPSGVNYFAVQAFDADGLFSAYSAEVSKVNSDCPTPPGNAPPLSPGDLTVDQDNLIAYTLVQSENRIALVPVGTVAPGTSCDGSQLVRDANGVEGYVVPRSAVTWAGSVRARVVVAKCG